MFNVGNKNFLMIIYMTPEISKRLIVLTHLLPWILRFYFENQEFQLSIEICLFLRQDIGIRGDDRSAKTLHISWLVSPDFQLPSRSRWVVRGDLFGVFSSRDPQLSSLLDETFVRKEGTATPVTTSPSTLPSYRVSCYGDGWRHNWGSRKRSLIAMKG